MNTTNLTKTRPGKFRVLDGSLSDDLSEVSGMVKIEISLLN